MGQNGCEKKTITEQLGAVFKNLQMPEDIVDQIIETLNEVHEDKIEFHNKEFDKLTTGTKNYH